MREIWELISSQFRSFRHEGSISRNISYVFGSKVLMLLAGLLITPILSRIYDQEAFGTFALLNHIAAVLGSVAGLKLSEAFILHISETQFRLVAKVSLFFIIITVLLSELVFLFAGDPIMVMLGIDVPTWLLFCLPVLAGVYAFEEFQVNQTRRAQEYKRSSGITSATDLVSRFFAIAFGIWVKANYLGLLSKEVFRVLANIVLRARLIFRGDLLPMAFEVPSSREMRAVLSRYWQFPSFQMPGVLAGMFSMGLPLYLIGIYYTTADLGDFSITVTLLNYPVFMLSNSIVSVYQQKAAIWQVQDKAKLSRSASMMFLLLLAIGSVGFGIVFWYGEDLFALFLGEKWRTAGTIATALVPLFILRLAGPPIYSLRVSLNTQHWNLVINVLQGLLAFASFYIVHRTGGPLIDAIWYITFTNTVLLFISVIMVMHRLKVNLVKLIFLSLATMGIGICLSGIPTLWI